jgi:hypothetical protein
VLRACGGLSADSADTARSVIGLAIGEVYGHDPDAARGLNYLAELLVACQFERYGVPRLAALGVRVVDDGGPIDP